MSTTIQVSDELWEKLNRMKTKDDKTFEDVLWNLIKKKEESK
jgi:predicted CopG family antitoxin